MDVAYILGHQDDGYEELRYSLRSLRNVAHGEVWIVGAPPPSWARNVGHLPVEQASLADRQQASWWKNRKTNMRRNILAALESPEISEPFLYMNDDFILVEPFTDKPLPHLGTISQTHGKRLSESGAYQDTYRWLVEQGISDPLHVSEHVPMVLDSRLTEWMRDVWHIVGFPVASVWGNLAGVPLIRGGDWVLKHEKDHSETWPETWWSVSTVSRSFENWPVGEKLRGLFPEKSEYER